MSWQNLLLQKVLLPARGSKKLFESAERTRASIEATTAEPPDHSPPPRLAKHLDIAAGRRRDWPVYEFTPRDRRPGPVVLYFHGGAYIREIGPLHWSFLRRLIPTAGARVLAPIYPLGPVAGAATVVATATEIAVELGGEVGGEGFVLLGDSAGAGLALAVAQALRDAGRPPRRCVLVSPWLDLRTDGPEQRRIEPDDAMLAIPGLRVAGEAYAAELPVTDPRASPLLGEMTGLPPLSVFTGTRDLIHPDSLALGELAAAAGVEAEVVVAAGQPHAYPLLPSPEGRAALRRIAALLAA